MATDKEKNDSNQVYVRGDSVNWGLKIFLLFLRSGWVGSER